MGKQIEQQEVLEFEIKFYEGILDKSPEFIEALTALGNLYTKAGNYKKGLTIDLKLLGLRPQDSIVLYNLACSYSLLNELDNALKFIKHAIECGYDNIDYLYADTDLDNLKNDPRFKEYMAKLPKSTHL